MGVVRSVGVVMSVGVHTYGAYTHEVTHQASSITSISNLVPRLPGMQICIAGRAWYIFYVSMM